MGVGILSRHLTHGSLSLHHICQVAKIHGLPIERREAMRLISVVLLVVTVLLLPACGPGSEGREEGRFLREGEKAILILDFSILAEELREMRFECTQGPQSLKCVWLE